MNINEALKNAVNELKNNKISEPILKARMLLAFLLDVKKEYLVIHSEDELKEAIVKQYNEKIKELTLNKPIQYIINQQEFMKLKFYVDENVLIPRQDTEILVYEVINYCKKCMNQKFRILDLCTGSGAIGISLAKYIENSYVVCSDFSKKALEVARINAEFNKITNIEFIYSNLFDNITGKFDIIVSNPPYIKRGEIVHLDKEVQNEPHMALDGGIDGLDFYRKIIQNVNNVLEDKGAIFLEIGYDQNKDVTDLLKENVKIYNVETLKDLAGNDRVIKAFCKKL